MSSSGASSEDNGGCHHDVPSFVLLDTRSYITGGRSNSTTATSKTSTDLPIQVTFCAVPPPDLSYLFVHCPGLEVSDLSLAPRVLSTDADLVLRVHRDPMSLMFPSHSDYFVYKMNPHNPRLDLIPNPHPERFNDHKLAIAGGIGFVVATLKIRPLCDFSFVLHLYRSGPDGEPGSWTSQRVSVEDPPEGQGVPDSRLSTCEALVPCDDQGDHARGCGTAGFVDLWRGIVLCDLLDDDGPKLRDMPLPLPAKGNWSKFLITCPYYCRDIAVSQSRDTIKYVEMEITRPTKVTDSSTSDDADSYYEWLRRQERPSSYWVPGSWKITTWSMPIAATSWDTWHRRCTLRSEDISLPAAENNTRNYELLRKLIMSSGGNEEKEKPTLSLGCLRMAHPTLSIADDDDVVYLLCKGTSIRSVEMEVAVDVRAGTLRGVAKLDTKKHVGFMRGCLATGISQHLKPTGTCGNCELCVDEIIRIG